MSCRWSEDRPSVFRRARTQEISHMNKILRSPEMKNCLKKSPLCDVSRIERTRVPL